MRITLMLDDGLLRIAQELTVISNKSALIDAGLRALIERPSAAHLAALGATLPKLKNVSRRRKTRN